MEYWEIDFEGMVGLPKLQEAGNEGWELLDVRSSGQFTGMNYSQYTAVFRRDAGAAGNWEYHIFNIAEVPQSWHDHIRSLGWASVGTCIYRYYGTELYVFKRPGSWAGADDGDVLQHLRSLGWVGGNDTQTLSDILKLKWERSQQEGRDIGTFRAVKLWLAHTYLRSLDPNLPVGNEKQILEELLALRAARGSEDFAPPLYQVIHEWRVLPH
jgi:hypothetical protein